MSLNTGGCFKELVVKTGLTILLQKFEMLYYDFIFAFRITVMAMSPTLVTLVNSLDLLL